MARLSKNGLISGGISNLVFVNQGDRNVVRSKPDQVRQSANTKKAAGIFGYISKRDAQYRRKLMQLCKLVTDDRYAYRHRSQFYKMATSHRHTLEGDVSIVEGNPKLMEGFGFNRHLEWQNTCRFFPQIQLDTEMRSMTITIPKLVWNQELKAPPKTHTAKLRIICIAALPDLENYQNIELLKEVTLEVYPGKQIEETRFTLTELPEGQLLFVIGEIRFQQSRVQQNGELLTTANSYLWGGRIEKTTTL